MHEHSAHAEHVYTSAQLDSAAASSPVVASWRRCMTIHQLAPEDQRAPLRLTDQEFRRSALPSRASHRRRKCPVAP
ncbi:hypothetical protein ACC724_39645, partial [Rhizobium ruizarguesonis]